MTRRQFAGACKSWKAKEFAANDAWRDGDRKASWEKGFINTLHD